MEPDFWIARWNEGQIGFHLREVNPALIRHWSRVARGTHGPVLVPLCGKSKDLFYLKGEGHRVTGIELSPLAIQSFWNENSIQPEVRDEGSHRIWTFEGITLIEGDFFSLRSTQIETPTLVYDRAAMIALPPKMRDAYCLQLQSLAPRATLFLITLDYPPQEKSAPPFSVSADEVLARFGETHTVEILESNEVLHENPGFQNQGVTSLIESIFLLTPK